MGAQAEGLYLHHTAIAVFDVDAVVAHYQQTFGAQVILDKRLDDQGVRAVAMTPAGNAASQTEVELIAPLVEGGGSIAKFLATRGEGLHHLAWAVEDVEKSIHSLQANGVQMIDASPRIGLHGTPVAFVHPRGSYGVLTELVQIQ